MKPSEEQCKDLTIVLCLGTMLTAFGAAWLFGFAYLFLIPGIAMLVLGIGAVLIIKSRSE